MNHENDFERTIKESFTIAGRGIVVTGKPQTGKIEMGEDVEIWNPDGTVIIATIIGRELACSRTLNLDNTIGLLLRKTETLTSADSIKNGAFMRLAR